ncbi:hypothetical protein BJX66DRAFT_336684 [Aspergillus keveii]|uniref:Uncharacterized protein n=1 Tax=Aspergillus keveii TaxID=714993 RepID=A0ABR4G9S2_9EURO
MAHGWIDWKPPRSLTQDQPNVFRSNLLSLTKRLYDGLKADGKIIDWGGYNLVAALYIPKAGVFVSTIPRGRVANDLNDLIADWRTAAPRLYRETSGRRVSPTSDPRDAQRLLAEDGVLYRYERGVQGQNHGHTYPKGSRIFVYGKRGGYDHEPGEVIPCVPDGSPDGSTSTGRNPACDVVLQRLDVTTTYRLTARGARIPVSHES